jgi:hypothetical protein
LRLSARAFPRRRADTFQCGCLGSTIGGPIAEKPSPQPSPASGRGSSTCRADKEYVSMGQTPRASSIRSLPRLRGRASERALSAMGTERVFAVSSPSVLAAGVLESQRALTSSVLPRAWALPAA